MQNYGKQTRQTAYRLDRLVEGKWYEWGTYTDPVKLAKAAHELGGYGYKRIRVVSVDG